MSTNFCVTMKVQEGNAYTQKKKSYLHRKSVRLILAYYAWGYAVYPCLKKVLNP